MEELKLKILNKATKIVLEEIETSGKRYSECIDEAINKVCEELGISEKDRIKMF